jgi:hypothetical protein
MNETVSNIIFSDQAQSEWFAKKALQILYSDVRFSHDQISVIKAYYNETVKSSIIRVKFGKRSSLSFTDSFHYFLLDFRIKEKRFEGTDFENSISDKESFVVWINDNEVLTFYPDNNIMSLLASKI